MIEITKIDPMLDIAVPRLYKDLEPGMAFTMYGGDVLRIRTVLGHFAFYDGGKYLNHDSKRFLDVPIRLVVAKISWKIREGVHQGLAELNQKIKEGI